jgi:hypothetical protein
MSDLVEITPRFHIGEKVLVGEEHLPPDLWGDQAVVREISVIICEGRNTVLYGLEVGHSRAYRTALEDVLISLEELPLECESIVLRHRYGLWQPVKINDAPGARDFIGLRGTIEQIYMVASGEEFRASYYVSTGSGRRYIQEADLTRA